MKDTQCTIHIILATILILVLSACGSNTNNTPATDDAVLAASLSVQLSWLDNIEFSSFYIAKENGYYSERNLEVSLIPVFDDEGNYRSAVEQVVSGETNFGITNSGDVLIAREAGEPIVAIMAIYQRHPLVFISLADTNLAQPQDLVGKTVHVSATSLAIYQSLLGSQGIDLDQINMIDRTDYTIQSLVNGDADVIDGWVITELAELNATDIDVNTIYPVDYGVDMYADVIITTEDMVQNQPELVQGFIDATLQGLNESVENPRETAEITITYVSDIPAVVVEESAQLQVALIAPPSTNPGTMTEDIWEFTLDLMLEQGLMSDSVNIADAYDLTFVNNYYENQ